MNRVLQAGHWKSLKTSITIGAFLEPTETCGSTSGTAVVNWAALMPSAGASSSAKRPAKLRASELAFRKRSTQSSSISYTTRTNQNITCDLTQIEALPQSMCTAGASALIGRMRRAAWTCLRQAGSALRQRWALTSASGEAQIDGEGT